MEYFGLYQVGGITEGSPDVLFSHFVFPRNLLPGHASSKSPNNPGDRDSGAPDHRFAMLDLWVNNNALIHLATPPFFHILYRFCNLRRSSKKDGLPRPEPFYPPSGVLPELITSKGMAWATN
jgi:hypothetical protein